MDDTPATYDGITPLPAPRWPAPSPRTKPVWHHVFTNPIVDLPVPAEKYRPTAEMVEHLRLQNPRCAVPGCPRPTTDDAENDHIEFDHVHPSRGGVPPASTASTDFAGDTTTSRPPSGDRPHREPDGTTT